MRSPAMIWFIAIISAYLGLCLLMYGLQDRLIFFAPPLSEDRRTRWARHERTFCRQGICLHGWLIRDPGPNPAPLVVYFGGNAEEVSLNLDDLARLGAVNCLFVNYRGYGRSQGRPGEKPFFDDALYLLDHVAGPLGWPPERIVLMGRSLGSAVATHVASRRPVAGVILVTPFDSLGTVARSHYPIFPVRWMLRHRFDSAALAPRIQSPLLCLAAGNDEIIPSASTQRLVDLWAGPARMVTLPAAGHNDIQSFDTYWQEIRSFIASKEG